MYESKLNRIEIDIINENCVKINANCNPKSIEERRNQESKESLLQISNNSLILSNTLSSVNTIRISKNSLAGSMTIGGTDTQNKETPKKKKTLEEFKGDSNFDNFYTKNENSNEIKKPRKYKNLKIEISKINNYFDKNSKNDDEEFIEDQNNSNLCSQSVIYLSKNDEMNKLEISNKSIFFTPSICNYYQKSYIENSPNQESFRLRGKNICDINDESIPKAINIDNASNKMTPTQIRYNKGQLQSCEKNEKTIQSNSNKIIKSKEKYIPNRDKLKNDLNFEETNNFTCNNTIIDKDDHENIGPKEFRKEFQSFHDLFNEIKKELVLNISSIEEEPSINLNKFDEEDKCPTGNSNNYFIKNLGLNFCDIKLNNEIASVSINENEISNSVLGFTILEDKKFKTDPILASKLSKNCLSCISEISINIKPCRTSSNVDKVFNNKDLISSNLIIQKPESISISIDEKKIPINNKVTTISKKKYTSSVCKNNLLKKIYSKPENYIQESHSKIISNGNCISRPNSSRKTEFRGQYLGENKTPDLSSKRKNSKIKNLSTFDVMGSNKNKVIKSIIMNLVGNLVDSNQPKDNLPVHRNLEKYINKSFLSPTNVQTPTAAQISSHNINTTNSMRETESNTNRPNSNNNVVIKNKKKEYLELVKLLSSNCENQNRNKLKVQEQRTNSKGKTFEVSINLDQNEKRESHQSGKKPSGINTSQNNSKSNSLSKKDSSSTTSTIKNANSNRSIAQIELNKLQSSKLENRNTKKNIIVPINTCPQTSKNKNSNKIQVSDLMSQQRKNSQNKKGNNSLFININNDTPTMNNKKLQCDFPSGKSCQKKSEESSSSKKIVTSTNINLERNCESYNNQAENRSLFKNEIPVNIVKHKSDFVKIINNFSNYTKIKKDSIGKEYVNFINDNNYDFKKVVTSLKIRNSGGDEGSILVDEN